MKKTLNILILFLTILSVVLSMQCVSFAISEDSETEVIVNSVSSISVVATRPTTTSGKVVASGSLTAPATSITTKATLYEYTSSGSLISSGVSPVTKVVNNCSVYNFSTTFSIQQAKKYKVKLEITDVTNGITNKATFYSNIF